MPAARLTTRLPSFWSALLGRREVLDQVHLAVGDDDVGRALDDRPHEVGDALLRVLVVAVGVDDDVGAELQRVVDAVLEGAGQSLVAGVPDEVGHAEGAGDLDRPVGGAVVDDDDDDLVDALDRPRDRLQDRREGLLLVQARHLHDELHGHSIRDGSARAATIVGVRSESFTAHVRKCADSASTETFGDRRHAIGDAAG